MITAEQLTRIQGSRLGKAWLRAFLARAWSALTLEQQLHLLEHAKVGERGHAWASSIGVSELARRTKPLSLAPSMFREGRRIEAEFRGALIDDDGTLLPIGKELYLYGRTQRRAKR